MLETHYQNKNGAILAGQTKMTNKTILFNIHPPNMFELEYFLFSDKDVWLPTLAKAIGVIELPPPGNF